MIIATAGHVDHGKTSLVRHLTGVDTDRLAEEKSRGLTIDLGFAYTTTRGGHRLGFVDVPGHIRFIGNMLAGVGAVDFALLVVAADDGPMPQTREHLAILDLLGLSRGLVALTKIDRVETPRISEVTGQISALLHGTSLQGARILPVSSTEGDGLDELSDALELAARQTETRNRVGYFRLAIDRSFSVKGAGLVTTGSVFTGAIRTGDELYLQPGNRLVRVRGLHTQSQATEVAGAGDRCAANIAGAGIDPDSVHRGDWLTSNPAATTTRRFDANIKVLGSESGALRHWTPVHLHTAASHVTGRVATLEARSIAPGAEGLVQIQTDSPVLICTNDRLIIRDQAAQRTIGGGRVLDPVSPQRGRARPFRIEHLHGINQARSTPDLVRFLLDHHERGIAMAPWENALNLPHADLLAMADGLDGLVIEDQWLIGQQHYETCTQILLKSFATDRSGDGLTVQQLGQASGIRNPVLLAHLNATLIRDGRLINQGGRLALPGQRASLTPAEQVIWDRAATHLGPDVLQPPVIHDLARQLNMAPRDLEKVLSRCVQIGLLVRPVKNRFFHREAMAALRIALGKAADTAGDITVKQYRDSTGIGRNLAIELLEYFDGRGITRRQGDARRIIATRQT